MIPLCGACGGSVEPLLPFIVPGVVAFFTYLVARFWRLVRPIRVAKGKFGQGKD